jgi:hypothetical protein
MFVLVGVWGISAIFYSDALGVDANDGGFNYDNYAAVLRNYVDDAGLVNYKGLQAKRGELDEFVTAFGRLDGKLYEKWDEKAKIAFWLNAYNAFTLKAIIDNYPIKSSFFRSRVYPKNSIRQIPGVWDKITFTVMGQDLTLEHIEHKILREGFDEPRIHMALVCAAIGCPPLRNEPYLGEELDDQLNGQTRRFLASLEKFKIERSRNRLYLSPILKWFAEDFINRYGSQENIAEHSREVSAVLNFIAAYLKKTDKDYILRGEFKIKYLKYNWSLNEQAGSK